MISPTVFRSLYTGTMTVSGSTISGNISTNVTTAGGVDNRGTLTVSDSTITHNKARGGEGDDGGSDGHGVGGGVYNLGTFASDIVSVVKKNEASTSNDDIFP